MGNSTNRSQVYRVLKPYFNSSKNGDTYQAFEIHDGDKEFTAHAWNGQYQGPQKLEHGQKVHIQGKWSEFNGQHLLKCQSIQPSTAECIAMRRSRKRVRVLYLRLTSAVIKQFMSKVFLDENMLEFYITQPSASSVSHNYPGGMLIHSVSKAWEVFQRSDLDGPKKDLAIVGHLLSDMGLYYFRQKSSNSAEGLTGADDTINPFIVLDDAIQWLYDQDEYQGLMIRHYLAWH